MKGIRISLQEMEYFISVAEEGSFTAAAEKLYTAQSRISTAVRKVEDYYHVQAFSRSPKGASLTRDGEELFIEFKSILNRLAYLRERTRQEPSGTLRLMVAAQHHIPGIDAFAGILQNMSGEKYRCGYHECSTAQVLERVSSEKDDLGIIYFQIPAKDQMIKNLRNRDLIFNHIAYDQSYVYLHRDHPLASEKRIRLAELDPYPFVTYDRVPDTDPCYTNIFGTEVNFRRIISVSDRATAYSLMHGCMAFAVGTGFYTRDTLFKDILAIPVAEGFQVEIGWVCRSGKILTALEENFTEYIQNLKK